MLTSILVFSFILTSTFFKYELLLWNFGVGDLKNWGELKNVPVTLTIPTFILYYISLSFSSPSLSPHLRNPRFIHYEHNLLITATSSSKNSTQVIIKIMSCVLFTMDLEKEEEGEKEENRKRELNILVNVIAKGTFTCICNDSWFLAPHTIIIIRIYSQIHFKEVQIHYKDNFFLTLIWNTESPLIQATNLDRVVLPAPLTAGDPKGVWPIKEWSHKWDTPTCCCLSIWSMHRMWSRTWFKRPSGITQLFLINWEIILERKREERKKV